MLNKISKKIVLVLVCFSFPLIAMDYKTFDNSNKNEALGYTIDQSVNLIVKFKDKLITEKLSKVPELDSTNINRDEALNILEEINNQNQILLKHNKSLSLGYDSFTVYSDMESIEVIDKLLKTNYFTSVSLDRKIKQEVFSVKKIDYTNDISASDLSAGKYNDPFYYLQKTFDLNEGENLGLSNIDKARDNIVKNMDRKVRVAVLDSGSFPHEDVNFSLEGYDFTSITGELDDNGLFKRKFRDNDPTAEGISSSGKKCVSGHGLAVSSIINATANNGRGVVGMLPSSYVDLIPVRIGFCGIGEENKASAYRSDIADAIYWASGGSVQGVPDIKEAVDVINISYGSLGECSAFFQDVVNYAYNKGISIIISAGNDSVDVSLSSMASCKNILSVGSTAVKGGMSDFSNYGDISFSSIGEEWILPYVSTDDFEDGNYGRWQGTSFSAPMTTGVVAMMKLKHPELLPDEIFEILKRTAIENRVSEKNEETEEITSKIGSICADVEKGCGAGIVDSFKALTLYSDRTSVGVAEIKHKYKGYNTKGLSKYMLGLDSTSGIKTCDMYEARWGILTNEYEDIEHKIYTSVSADDTLTASNSDLQRVVMYPNAFILAKFEERIGVQICKSGDCGAIFELIKPVDQIPLYCESYTGK
jgi:serine protease